jgi:phosphoglucosamine mutase
VGAAEESLKDQGRVLLRPSGTEPVIRVMVEGQVEQQVRGLAEAIANTIREVAAA